MFFVIASLIAFSGLNQTIIRYSDWEFDPFFSFALLFSFSHLFASFFRTHLNKKIFAEYPIRFKIVPIILFIALLVSDTILIIAIILVIWADVWHSSMQTFGIGRLYDLRNGNDVLHFPRHTWQSLS